MESDKGPAVVRRTKSSTPGIREVIESTHPNPAPIHPEGILFYRNLVAALESEEPLMAPPEQGRRVMAVMQAIRDSANANQVVPVDGENIS